MFVGFFFLVSAQGAVPQEVAMLPFETEEQCLATLEVTRKTISESIDYSGLQVEGICVSRDSIN